MKTAALARKTDAARGAARFAANLKTLTTKH